ncbi:hypothetical protein [Streptomyces sp. NPDC093094]|uniref:hypothetical protein n=1 Tax=Streptomyces sp. NPDC093094 TaxID=3366026 RepID=UPI0037F598F2
MALATRHPPPATRRLGARIAENGRRRGHPGRLIGGRRTHAHPGVVVRLALAMVIGIGIVAQMQVWTSRLGDLSQAAVATQRRAEDTVIELTTGSMTAAQTDRFRGSLPSGSILLTRTLHDPGPPRKPWVSVEGSCQDLRTLRVACARTGEPKTAAAHRVQVEELRRGLTRRRTPRRACRGARSRPMETGRRLSRSPAPHPPLRSRHPARTDPLGGERVRVTARHRRGSPDRGGRR